MRILNSNFVRCTIFEALMLALVAAWPPASSHAVESTPPVPPDQVRVAQKMVDGLSNDSFLVRAKARENLLKLGRAAIEPLEAATKSEDSETRLRATELLIALRGRGLLGIDMMVYGFDSLPPYGAGVKAAREGLPAAQAGLQSGDLIVALNGEAVPDNNVLMHLVFVTGPARVMDATVERGIEKLHMPILLTLNQHAPPPMATPVPAPPVNLELELPPSDDPQARAEARERALQQTRFGVIMQGNTVTAEAHTQVQAQPISSVDAKAIENDFENLKAEVGKNSSEAPAEK